ncbi:DNA cytosine methyltransferase [Petroclostridium sp. X23]|uniref:DNA cytosine methyltransferase n=1 Tax=Petroclostridium sp. X23 TaxID=3045146 RepID=UPI0024AE0ADB|nr:DNA cytosine methyltransferase [Petroclostridium sp. X23]WHH57174.1 DNA cytosine methyltransferase [Petroclostridium sp. X23]
MYKIVDLFAGAGGLSLGFEMTKQFDIVAIVENNKNATQTYIKNHPGLKNYDDIMQINFKDILKEHGKIDVVIGGPPCQGFSNANRQKRRLINESNELVKRYVVAIKELEPDVFVMENVKTIASNKHSFCLTYNDQHHIRNRLGCKIYNRDVILYEGMRVRELTQLIKSNEFVNMVLLNEEQLYYLYNIYKKKNKIGKYLEKSINERIAKEILNCIGKNVIFPDWYNNIIRNTSEALQGLINTKECNSDMSNRLKLFWDVQRLFQGILELNAQAAVYEVLPGNDQIQVRMQSYIVIDFIKKSFEHLGYKINGNILNAADFGVPQCRERYIMIGIKKSSIKNKNVDLPSPLIANPKNYVTVKKAIADLERYPPSVGSMDEVIKKNYIPVINSFYRELVIEENSKIIRNHVCTDTSETALKRFEVIKQGENFHSLPNKYKTNYEDPGRTQNTIYKRLMYDQPSDTVVNVRKSMWIHPTLDRAISAREAARLQSFPDKYEFVGTKDSVYQQIGNAVPPILGRAVAEVVLDLLDCKQDFTRLAEIYDKYDKKK